MNGRNQDNLDYDLGDLQETGAAVAVTIFRPSHDQAVLVVAATDIEEVQRQLGPQLPDRLCVIPSRWTTGQLEDARDHLRAMRELWGIFMIGRSNDEQGQPFVHVSPVRVTDDIADWITSQPDGLIQVRPWLAPIPPKT